jgi:protein FRA10AC1
LSEDDLEAGARIPHLRAFELPFAYEEAGEKKSALVKVRVCERCVRKLTYKPGEEEGRKEEKKGRKPGRKERDTEQGSDRSASPSRRHVEDRPHRSRSDSPERRHDREGTSVEQRRAHGKHPPDRRRSP